MPQARTSQTHPLRVDFVPVPHGRLGMTFAPGKVQPNPASGEAWSRDLNADAHRLHAVFGAIVLVSVIELRELGDLGIAGLAATLGSLGMRWIHVPVVDVGVPKDPSTWLSAMRQVHADLQDGLTVVVHCNGGLGRTGTFAASMLASFGTEPHEAIAAVRSVRKGTIENALQEDFVGQAARLWRDDLRSRYRGCMLAGAVGDALGAPVEFKTLAEIRHAAGGSLVREMMPAYGIVGAITDDTQMTLFTAEGLLRAFARYEDKGICDIASIVEFAYLRWLWTQGEPPPERLRSRADGWLFSDPRLHARRGPGKTCMSTLQARSAARRDESPRRTPLNDSKGCGAVMRTAPIGLLGNDPWGVASDCARLTHQHPAGYQSAALLAEIIREVVVGHRLADACRRVWTRRANECHDDVRRAMDAAFALLAGGEPPTPEHVESLGAGWVGEEALAISIYCALACGGIEDALALAVTHSGDSDTTGAITGNLLGAELGESAIPSRWLEVLELRDVVERLADALWSAYSDGRVGEDYPGW